MEEEFVEGDRATRFRVLGLLAVVILLILLERVTSPDGALRVADPVRALKTSVDRLLIVVLAAAAVLFGISIYLLRMAIKVKRSGRWPPPGMRTAFRTKVRRGKYAVWIWIVLFVGAGVSMIQVRSLPTSRASGTSGKRSGTVASLTTLVTPMGTTDSRDA